MDLIEITKQACVEAKKAGAFIREQRKTFQATQVETKSFNQLVSYVDKGAEEMLISGLRKILPEAGFITEEAMIENEQKEYTWIIDPLDGTTNFIHALPVYSVSIGLLKGHEVIVGVIYDVERDNLFYAAHGQGAWMDETPIHVKESRHLSETLLATGFPYYDFKYMNGYLDTLRELMKQTRGMRRMGSAAIDLAYTACGRFDGFFEYGLSPWDVAGGICILKEAGGIVSDFEGGKDYLFGKSILAAAPGIHDALASLIKERFYR